MDTGVRNARLIASAALAFSLTIGCESDDELVRTEVGDAEVCESVALWPALSTQLEDDLVDLVNRSRAAGEACPQADGDGGEPAGGKPALRLEPIPEMTCAARLHAHDQIRNGSSGHEGDDGSSAFERLVLAGYTGVPRHELLASDFVQVREALAAWMGSPEHCAAIMDPKISEVGAAHRRSAKGEDIRWVLVTGELR